MDFNFETVAAAAELQINDALNALQAVMKNALIRLCPDGHYRFDHVAIREAIFVAMSPSFHNQIRKRLEETAAEG